MPDMIQAYIFYPSEKSPGILVEVLGGYVCEVGNDAWRPLSAYKYGRFIRLVAAGGVNAEDMGKERGAKG